MVAICFTMVLEAFSILPMYNPKYFIDNEMWQYRDPKGPAIHTFVASDGTAIGIFQGKKGARPDLDFRMKILQPKPDAKPFLLPHDEWVVDLLLKAQHHKDAVVRYWTIILSSMNLASLSTHWKSVSFIISLAP